MKGETSLGSDIQVNTNDHFIDGIKFPTMPPVVPRSTTAYCRSVFRAPYTALKGVVIDGKQPQKFPVTPRCRTRHQVGFTNRWRLPESLGSDLLGNTQAIRAIRTHINDTLIQIITAENPSGSVNLDPSEPYKFRQIDDRPSTVGLCPNKSDVSVLPTLNNSKHSISSAGAVLERPSKTSILKSNTKNVAQSNPMEIFYYHSQKSGSSAGADVLLRCLGHNWELHKPFLQKSTTLSSLLTTADQSTTNDSFKIQPASAFNDKILQYQPHSTKYKPKLVSHPVDQYESKSNSRLSNMKNVPENHNKNITVIDLDITDSNITSQAMAIALGNLYCEISPIDACDVIGVLAASEALEFEQLKLRCIKTMIQSISVDTVCDFYSNSLKYQLPNVKSSCEKWLEINLLLQLCKQVQLRLISPSLMENLLSSKRLFVFNEYALYQMLCNWLYLRLRPNIKIMPTFNTVIAYFNCFPKDTALTEREDFHTYASLFSLLRLHGITDTRQINEMRSMNIIPQKWIIKLLADNQYSLQNGGDMSLSGNSPTSFIRQGFILDQDPHYHSEIYSLHGFHFELRASQTNGAHKFFLKRLKPNDPVLSFKQCERHTFSMRPDREVCYNILVQQMQSNGQCRNESSGILRHRFGLGDQVNKSQVFLVDGLSHPIFVTISLYLPPS